MNRLQRIGLFFASWAAIIAGCYFIMFVVRFFANGLDFTKIIPRSGPDNTDITILIVSLVAAFLMRKE